MRGRRLSQTQEGCSSQKIFRNAKHFTKEQQIKKVAEIGLCKIKMSVHE
jgi:hypothetical protein